MGIWGFVDKWAGGWMRGRSYSRACGTWRSLVSALVWGTRGRRFKSGRPDLRCRAQVERKPSNRDDQRGGAERQLADPHRPKRHFLRAPLNGSGVPMVIPEREGG